MKDLERENARLRRLVADLSLEKQVLADVASGNFGSPPSTAGRWAGIGFNASGVARGSRYPEAPTAQAPVAERWIQRAAASAPPQSRLELRLRAGADPRRTLASGPDADRRA